MADPLTAAELEHARWLAADRPDVTSTIVAGLLATLDRLTVPTRFDLDDRSTWPEEGPVLLWSPSMKGWLVARELVVDEDRAWWYADEHWDATNGDLWWPLPSTPAGEQ